MKALVALLVLVVLVGGGFYFYTKVHLEPSYTPTQSVSSDSSSQNQVDFQAADLKSGSKLPVGFPSGLPVETNNVKESYSARYPSLNATEYSVSYTSVQSASTLWDLYSSYMMQNGYQIDTNASSKSSGQIIGTKGADKLSVVITNHSGTSLVQLSYLAKS